MEFIQAILLAIVQGITEFLPISSSGHLVLTPYIFGWDYKGLGFDVALHFGTVIAIIVFFWKDIGSIISSAFGKKLPATSPASSAGEYKLPPNLLWQILLATIPAGIVGFFISDLVEKYLHTPVLIAINLAVFGIILWISDVYSRHSERSEESRDPSTRPQDDKPLSAVSYKLSFLIGLFQAVALMPGVSRSGITITGGRFFGLNRESAARFSFLLGIPAMLGAAVLEATKIEIAQIDLVFILAIAVSALVGFFTIKYLIEYLKRGTLAIFAIYRIVLALIVLAVYYLQS